MYLRADEFRELFCAVFVSVNHISNIYIQLLETLKIYSFRHILCKITANTNN